MDILNEISLFLQTSVQMGTHILFAIVGGIICEKVGNMNLGIEGMMLMGAAVIPGRLRDCEPVPGGAFRRTCRTGRRAYLRVHHGHAAR